jgi:SAM-dependent methyltransferase
MALVRSSAYNLPFEAGTFDNIICNSVLEHMNQPDDVLVECRRVLCNGGRIFVTVPSDSFESLSFGYRFWNFFGKPQRAESYAIEQSRHIQHRHYWNTSSISASLCNTGFTVETIVPFGSPLMLSVSDVAHTLRVWGIGGSRYSLLSSGDPKRTLPLRVMQRLAIRLEMLMLERESNLGILPKFGGIATSAIKTNT